MRWVIGIAVSVALALLVGTPQAGERWDMPTAYAESNYHAENARLFAEAVGVCTGGSLEISVHANESLLKGEEIMRAARHRSALLLFVRRRRPSKQPGLTRARLASLAGRNLGWYSVPWPPQRMYFAVDRERADVKGIAAALAGIPAVHRRRRRATSAAGGKAEAADLVRRDRTRSQALPQPIL